MTPERAAVLERVAASVLALPSLGTVRVGIDGVDGAGKTMFGDEFRHHWNYSIFLRVEWGRNHRVRDRPEPGHHRYHEGQNIYFRECEPWQHASIVIDNDDLAAPFIVSSGEALEPGR